ncbi:MAG: hypothetical protein LBQ10_02795 [Desulfovibrio sp.]|jgi:hypothetical protein|nr:hypothetical protein [Desulfovibrio sp.]
MATKADCIAAAMKGGLGRIEAEAAVNALFEDKGRVLAARAEGKIVNAEKALAEAWAVRMDEGRAAVAIARKQAAVNILRRREIDARFAAVKAEGFTSMDALEALLVGSNKRFTGARDSIDSRRRAVRADFLGPLFNELEAVGAPVKKLFEDEAFNADVVREIYEGGQGAQSATRANAEGGTALPPGERERAKGSVDATARRVAGILSRYLEQSRLRQNEAGASIGRLDGYLPQSHDAWKLIQGKDARARWLALITDKLDLERSFGIDAETAATPEGRARVREILNDVYDNITMGRDMVTAAEKGRRTGPANLANRLARHRVLHFRDADAFMAYHAEYGKGHVLTGVLGHLDAAARNISLMEALGPNPEAMLKSVIAREARMLRETVSSRGAAPPDSPRVRDGRSPIPSAGGDVGEAHLKGLKDLQTAGALKEGKVAAWWAELTGEANSPVSLGLARYGAVARAVMSRFCARCRFPRWRG